jgi:hypothetical protein
MLKYIQHVSFPGTGFTTKDLKKLTYQLAEKYKLHHGFNGEDKSTVLPWLKGFLNHHPELDLRKSESKSAVQAVGFNKAAVLRF